MAFCSDFFVSFLSFNDFFGDFVIFTCDKLTFNVIYL